MLATLSILLLAATGVAAKAQPMNSCADCHQASVDRGRFEPPETLLRTSAHASLDCTDCHASISMDELDAASPKPHGASVSPVDCGGCHDDEAEIYQKHGRFDVGTSPDIPKCWDCHGKHDILPPSDPQSRVYPTNLPGTCKSCHTNTDILKKYSELHRAPLGLYETSVHGEAVQRGISGAAVCVDCHSARTTDGQPTAHRILSMRDPESSIHFFNIPKTCGKCHEKQAEDYWQSVHGRAVKNGQVDAPVCTNCHGEHGILVTSDPRSPVSPAHLAAETCAPCHESVTLNERFGIPAGQAQSYVDSYHGLKKKAGNVNVANCASCHGHHRILPETDPRSSIFPANLQNTCGRCHPGISSSLAQAPIHSVPGGTENVWPRFITIVYLWMIGVTIGLMLLHNIADWIRHVMLRSKVAHVVRLTAGEVGQHWVLMISFTVLTLSGFSLRFSEAWWVKKLFGWGGGEGFVIRGTVHRVAAVVFMVWVVWHLIYLFTRRGRGWLRDMLGSKRDLVDIKKSSLFFLGRRDTPPRFGRFSYMEKCEYWALLWGAVIMTATGLLLWFDNYFIERWHVSKVVLDVTHVVHYYEAWLASLAIFVWHIYGTVFRPSVYPMNPAWLTGKMPKKMYDDEHPEGPKPSVPTGESHANGESKESSGSSE